MKYKISENNIILTVKEDDFNLKDTLDCGQCFRFSEESGIFSGVAKGRILRASQNSKNIIFYNINEKEFKEIWVDYFDLNTDYAEMKKILSQNPAIKAACEFAGGIHIIKQEPWEALCSFIISQNNNIPRIKGIISRLCEALGEKIEGEYYSFPSPEKIAGLNLEDLVFLRAGFRAKYILDAAQKICGRIIDFDDIKKLPYAEAQKYLMQIKGVGPKVADCALLYGFYRIESFPMDVWMKRVVEEYFKDGFPEYAKAYGGIAQQYLFHYIRHNN